MPGQRGALHARRIIAHAAEHHQLAEIFGCRRIGGEQFVEFVQQVRPRRGFLPLSASVISEADAVEMAQPAPTKLASLTISPSIFRYSLQLVAAQRIVALGIAVGIFHGMAIPRTLAVVQNYFLIKVVNHQEKISFTF